MAYQRGLDEKHEQAQKHMMRDTRPLGARISEFLSNPLYTGVTIMCIAFVSFFIPFLSEMVFILSSIFFIYCFTRRTKLPFRLPQFARRLDYNDLKPNGKPSMSQGIYHFGNQKMDNAELWFNNSDMRTHVLVFGSTGSGKTEFLISLAYNALCQASGFIYVDGKGDNSLFAKIFSMVRSMGREDDMLLINFMTGARDVVGPQTRRLSNTINPFATGSSSMLAQLVVSLMDSGKGDSNGDMWKGRAIGFVEAIMRVLVSMRDGGYILLDANTIRNYFLLPRLEAMVIDKLFIRDGQESVKLDALPHSVMEPITNYVYNLPGYNKDKKGKQVSQVLEQHGYITMQLTRVFTSLADTYGHILRTNLAEVDLNDVVLNRRILCVLLPALEKSPDELSNLGKIIIATLRAMMAGGLGDGVEGSIKSIVDSKPTNSETPYLCILDEYGYYAVDGFAVVPAQARSLGFSVVFAGQDLPAFQKASKEEAASIGANTNIKICMKLEDPTETWDFFMKSAGETYVTQVDNFQAGSIMNNYHDGKSARFEKRSRLDLLDLKEQDPGEMHLLFRSKIVRAKVFYAAPKLVKNMRLNHFIKIDMPEDSDIEKLESSCRTFAELKNAGDIFYNLDAPSADDIIRLLNKDKDDESLMPSQPINSLYKLMNPCQIQGDVAGLDSDYFPDDFINSFFNDDEAGDNQSSSEGGDISLNVFQPLRLNQHLETAMIPVGNMKEFEKPILDKVQCRKQIEYMERLAGNPSQASANVSIELVSDIAKMTQYPPDNIVLPSEVDLSAVVHHIIQQMDQVSEGD